MSRASSGRLRRGEPGDRLSLGHDPTELERLDRQGRVLAPATRVILEAAGVRAGMRVLDLGCGVGDAAFVAADLIGATGAVVGIDRAPESVARATLRAEQQGRANVLFGVGDIHDPAPGGPYDAIIGRLVLMYVPDPAAVLETQARLLCRGGVVVTIEADLYSARSLPPTPLAGQAVTLLGEAFTRSGIDPALGPRLGKVLREAGLRGDARGAAPFRTRGPGWRCYSRGHCPRRVPLMGRTGVATPTEVGLATFERRLRDELQVADAVAAHPMLLGAWAK